jgi:hypothetical protein
MPDDLWALVEPLLPSPVGCSADDNDGRAEDGLASPQRADSRSWHHATAALVTADGVCI